MSSLYSAHARRASPLLTVSIKASVSGEQSFLCPRWHRTKELDTKCKAALSTWGGSTLFVPQKWSDSFLWLRIKMPRQQSYFWLSKRYAFRGSAPLTGRSKKKKNFLHLWAKKYWKKRKKRRHFQQRQMLCVSMMQACRIGTLLLPNGLLRASQTNIGYISLQSDTAPPWRHVSRFPTE